MITKKKILILFFLKVSFFKSSGFQNKKMHYIGYDEGISYFNSLSRPALDNVIDRKIDNTAIQSLLV